jgi:hypothetical protein
VSGILVAVTVVVASELEVPFDTYGTDLAHVLVDPVAVGMIALIFGGSRLDERTLDTYWMSLY